MWLITHTSNHYSYSLSLVSLLKVCHINYAWILLQTWPPEQQACYICLEIQLLLSWLLQTKQMSQHHYKVIKEIIITWNMITRNGCLFLDLRKWDRRREFWYLLFLQKIPRIIKNKVWYQSKRNKRVSNVLFNEAFIVSLLEPKTRFHDWNNMSSTLYLFQQSEQKIRET